MTQAEIDAALDQISNIEHRLTLIESDLDGVGTVVLDSVTFTNNEVIFNLYPREDNEGFYCHWWQQWPECEGIEGTTEHHDTRREAITQGIDYILRQV